MAANQRGRPKFEEGQALSRRIACRVRPDEEDEVRAAAEKAGMSLSEWMRQAILAAARKPKRKKGSRKKSRRKS